MTTTMTSNKEFVVSFMICFLAAILLMVNYGATSAPLPSVSVQSDRGANNSWRDLRVRQNIEIASVSQSIYNSSSALPGDVKAEAKRNNAEKGVSRSTLNAPPLN